tara:strand:- start:91 stop:513 length:423 start_codon:yes stop_codon:yes gene_type:complete
MAKEELKSGKKYFILVHNILLAFILFFILEYINANPFVILLLPLVFVIFLFKYTLTYSKSHVLYPILGGLFYIVSSNTNQFLLMSTLIFFYGVVVGTLQFDMKKTKKITNLYSVLMRNRYCYVLLRNLLFFVCLILFLMF